MLLPCLSLPPGSQFILTLNFVLWILYYDLGALRLEHLLQAAFLLADLVPPNSQS